MVETEQSAEPFPTLNWAVGLTALLGLREQQHIALALMIPLLVKMGDVLLQC